MAGPLGWPPLISGRLHVPQPRTTSSCACARRPSPIDMHRQPAAAQTRGTRDLALPDPPGASPCPNARRQTMTGAHSTIGRRTTSSESAPTCTPRSGRRPGFSWPASSPTRPPSRTSGSSSWPYSPHCPQVPDSSSCTATASNPRDCATGWAWTYTSPTHTVPSSG